MLLLLFHIGENRYAIDTAQIIEIVPMVRLRKIPSASESVAGVFNYRGNLVPVIDLCLAILGTPCQTRYSTRLVMMQRRLQKHFSDKARNGVKESSEDSSFSQLGLIVEGVTETVKVLNTDLKKVSILSQEPYFGELFVTEQGIIQQINWQSFIENFQPIEAELKEMHKQNGSGCN